MNKKIGMKVSKFKLVFIALCVATIIWRIGLYYILQEYQKYCEWFDEQWWSKWALRNPWWTWNGGIYVMVAGLILFEAWGVFFVKLFTRKVFPRLKALKDKKKPTVNPLEACHRLALSEGQKENKK